MDLFSLVKLKNFLRRETESRTAREQRITLPVIFAIVEKSDIGAHLSDAQWGDFVRANWTEFYDHVEAFAAALLTQFEADEKTQGRDAVRRLKKLKELAKHDPGQLVTELTDI